MTRKLLLPMRNTAMATLGAQELRMHGFPEAKMIDRLGPGPAVLIEAEPDRRNEASRLLGSMVRDQEPYEIDEV